MTRITIARNLEQIDALAPLWRELEGAAATLYQDFAWNRAAAAFLSAQQPCVIAAENANGAAIIPAAIDRDSGALTFLGDVLFDYRDVLSSDHEALAAAWRELARLGRPLQLTAVRADSPQVFWEAATREPFCGAPAVSLADTSADAFAQRHWRNAKQVRRLARSGVRLVRRDGVDRALVRSIYRQKTEQLAGDPHNVFAESARIDCMVEVCARAGERCEIFSFERDGAMISSLITFRDHPWYATAARPRQGRAVRRYYTTVFDHDWARYSPGVALLFEVARLSLAEGLDADFQTGEQFHKSRLATRSIPLYRISAHPSDIAAFAEGLVRHRRVAA